MKKVLILANSSAGLFEFRNDLVKGLLNEYQVVASLPDEIRTEDLTAEGVRVIKTDINRRGVNPKEDLSLYRAYRKLIKDEQPDVILTYTIKPNIYGGYAARRAGVPYFCTITGLGSAFQKTGIFKQMIVTMYKVALKDARCVFFQNSENKKVFEDCGIAGKKARLVNGSGVDLEAHTLLDYPSEENGIQILYMGRNMKEKGTDELLECAKRFAVNFRKKDICLETETPACKDGTAVSESMDSQTPAKCRQSDPRVTFKLLGYSDENYDEIIKDYESKGYIISHPFDTDVNKHLKECSAVILPTYHEGMSNVLQEAAAVGRVVIASDIPGCRETFEEGVTGFGARPRDVDSLVEAVKKCISLSREQREEMGRLGRAKMEREFDRKVITKAYLEEIRSVTEC